tara:strand:+ start:908 stop:1429 length:522 start_codon:yes stop_codon:yes gene_type:complete
MAIYFNQGTSPGAYWDAPLAEGWRLTSGFQGGAYPILNWEKQDDVHGSGTNGGPILTYDNSSGVFTFAQTSYYLVSWTHYAYLPNADSRYIEMYLYVSWNSGSNYDAHGYGTGSITNGQSGNNHSGQTCSSIVTGTPNTRMRFKVNVNNGSTYTGADTTAQTTCFTISKVAGI